METSFDEMIGLQTNQMNKKMLRFLNRSLEWYELTLEQWVVLSTLAEQDNINQKTLSVKIGKDPTSLLRILDIMEKKGFLERRQFPGDRRASSLFITAEGKRLKNEVAPFIEDRFQEITAGIPENEIEIYERVLKELDKNLDQLLDRSKD
jgi:MarR family transcriptional regulator for hemolysin